MNEVAKHLEQIKNRSYEAYLKFIKQDENFLCSLELEKEEITIVLIYKGDHRPIYVVFWKKELLFYGSDYRPVISKDLDSLECVITLLSFIILSKNDVSAAFFENYNEKQIEFREHGWDSLNLKCNDLLLESGHKEEARKYFEKYYFTL